MGAPLRHRFRVRYNECDRQGIVFNSHYLAYFDQTLTEMWREAFGGYDQMVKRGIDVVVAEARVRYLSPARFDDEIEIAMWIAAIGDSSLISRYEVRRADEPLTEGETRHVFVDARSLTKTSAPDWVRSGLEPFQTNPPAGSAQPVIERQ